MNIWGFVECCSSIICLEHFEFIGGYVLLVGECNYNLIVVPQGNDQHYNLQSESHCSEKERPCFSLRVTSCFLTLKHVICNYD